MIIVLPGQYFTVHCTMRCRALGTLLVSRCVYLGDLILRIRHRFIFKFLLQLLLQPCRNYEQLLPARLSSEESKFKTVTRRFQLSNYLVWGQIFGRCYRLNFKLYVVSILTDALPSA